MLNLLVALCLLISCAVPYIPVDFFPFISLFSLAVPLLVVINLVFLTYWIFKRKKQLIISALPLLLAYLLLGSFYKMGASHTAMDDEDLSIMSYNVRGFNKYDWIDDDTIGKQITDLIAVEDPDILCIQEHSRIKYKELEQYPYRCETPYSTRWTIQAIFSKFPIIANGSLNLPNTVNNIIYADILYKKDTVRVYNIHFQSFSIVPSKETITNQSSKKLLGRMGNTVLKQQEQANLFKEHIGKSPHKSIVCGDFNNTEFSNIYRIAKGDLIDTYDEKGTGYGRTFNFKYFPFRIDFILVDPSLEVRSHNILNKKLSDHFPIMASVRLPAD